MAFEIIKLTYLLTYLLTSFYRAAWNADAVLRLDFCPSVCPSVCLSVKRMHCDKTEEKSVRIFIPCDR